MNGLCQCGCGQPAPLAPQNDRSKGEVKGQPRLFIYGHNAKKHGMHGTPEYAAYINASDRCKNPNCKDYPNYGGRGIEFRFTSFEQWFAELGPRPSSIHSVDRMVNSGHYEPGNVRWSTRKEQNNNTRRNKKVA